MEKMDTKIFVLDTSVILYDHEAILNFGEHDVVIPITVLEELDKFKKGNDSKNYCAREFIRFLDQAAGEKLTQDWVPLKGESKGRFKVILHTRSKVDAEVILGEKKEDHKILNAALSLQEAEPKRRVILVTKDIALRLKAKSLNLHAEDYETGKIHDLDHLYSGKAYIENLPTALIDELYENGGAPSSSLPITEWIQNQYFVLKNGKKSALGFYNAAESAVTRVEKHTVYGVTPRNAEQVFAIHALMNPNIPLVTIQGVAGTGKTLLALASALEQRTAYRQIYISRPVVPLSNKDIGYLPGDIKDKMNPYLEPLWDNLKYIKSQFKESDKEYKRIAEMLETEKIEIAPLTYIRGRSLSHVFFIVDEAQNLTPHEVKTIITRAGEGTKIVFTGDVHQIDTPYLDAESNGLSYLIDRLKNNKLFAHITLEKGERSELANLANELL
jgi:PhoH-like ATPase